MLAGTCLFVLGLAVVFVTTGVVAGSVGQALYAYQDVITRVIGVVIIVLGLIFAGVLPLGHREWRVSWVPRAGWRPLRCSASRSGSAGRPASAPPSGS